MHIRFTPKAQRILYAIGVVVMGFMLAKNL